jgi:8-oxo-dGTP diphosphatase
MTGCSMEQSVEINPGAGVLRTLGEVDWANWTPEVDATLLFILQAGRVLLIHKKRGFGRGKINGPGGRIEPGETPLECAVREVREELCITPLHPEFCGTLHFQFRDGLTIRGHVFRAFAFTGEPQETEEAIPLWFAQDALPYDRMWADDRTWMPLMLAGQCFCGYYLFEGDTMLEYELKSSGVE